MLDVYVYIYIIMCLCVRCEKKANMCLLGEPHDKSSTGFAIISTAYVSNIPNGNRHPNAVCVYSM